jgi:transcription initiation factor IIE alpha subunit
MEKTNLQIVFETIKSKPMKSTELEESTSISKSTLFRCLKSLLDDGLIKNDDGIYKIIIPTPSIKDIYDSMYILHQQKFMDYKYRKLKTDSKTDELLISYINNPNSLKGKIEDYNFESLLDNVTKASQMLKHSI